jgi:ABC-2 type transport system permease protein
VPASLRLFMVGGLLSYRALFNWLTPWILVPTFLITPVLQILLFASVGRTAGVADAAFFVIGNAVLYAAIPCLFAMSNSIGNERTFQTLGLVLVSPARRLPLFGGRALPVILNGFCVSMFALVVGSALLGVHIAAGAWLPITATVAVCAFATTGLGLVTAAVAMRVRETATLSNIVFGVLILVTGANVPLHRLPGWIVSVSAWVPMTHGIAAARALAAGASWARVAALVAKEAGIGVLYAGVGLATLAFFEWQSRRTASLERA